MQWLKHAFAIEDDGPVEPNEVQRAVVRKVCVEIVRRHLTTPSLIALEMSRPLNFVGAQMLHFFAPFVSVFTNFNEYSQFATFLEKRGSIDFICRQIEELEKQPSERNDVKPNTEETHG